MAEPRVRTRTAKGNLDGALGVALLALHLEHSIFDLVVVVVAVVAAAAAAAAAAAEEAAEEEAAAAEVSVYRGWGTGTCLI